MKGYTFLVYNFMVLALASTAIASHHSKRGLGIQGKRHHWGRSKKNLGRLQDPYTTTMEGSASVYASKDHSELSQSRCAVQGIDSWPHDESGALIPKLLKDSSMYRYDNAAMNVNTQYEKVQELERNPMKKNAADIEPINGEPYYFDNQLDADHKAPLMDVPASPKAYKPYHKYGFYQPHYRNNLEDFGASQEKEDQRELPPNYGDEARIDMSTLSSDQNSRQSQNAAPRLKQIMQDQLKDKDKMDSYEPVKEPELSLSAYDRPSASSYNNYEVDFNDAATDAYINRNNYLANAKLYKENHIENVPKTRDGIGMLGADTKDADFPNANTAQRQLYQNFLAPNELQRNRMNKHRRTASDGASMMFNGELKEQAPQPNIQLNEPIANSHPFKALNEPIAKPQFDLQGCPEKLRRSFDFTFELLDEAFKENEKRDKQRAEGFKAPQVMPPVAPIGRLIKSTNNILDKSEPNEAPPSFDMSAHPPASVNSQMSNAAGACDAVNAP